MRYEVTRKLTTRYTYHIEAPSKAEAERIAREMGEVYADEISPCGESIAIRRDTSERHGALDAIAERAQRFAGEDN